MFANKFSNNKCFKAPRSEFCKSSDMNFYFSKTMDVNTVQFLNINITNSFNLTNNIMTDFRFNSNCFAPNCDGGTIEIFNSLPISDRKNDFNICSHKIENTDTENNSSTMSGFSYLIDLVKRFFLSWKSPEQSNSTNYLSDNKLVPFVHQQENNSQSLNCDLVNYINCTESVKMSSKNSKIGCDTSVKNTINYCQFEVDVMEDFEPCNTKQLREIDRQKKLQRKKQKRKETKTYKHRRLKQKDWYKTHNDLTKERVEDFGCDNYFTVGSFEDDVNNIIDIQLSISSCDSNEFPTVCAFFENLDKRRVSECESEDSFIIFVQDNDLSEDEECYSEDTEDSLSDISEDYCSEYEEISPENNHGTSSQTRKKVHFANEESLCTVHHLVKWTYAYQAARKGPWEEYARDRERFRMKILSLEGELSKVFDPNLRQKIYNERFKDS